MGIQIIAKNADFSALGLGNVNLSEIFIATAGITNETQKTALRTFYNSFKSAGFYKKFAVARLYFTGTSLGDSLNLLNPVLGVSAKQATFISDSAGRHTTAGWSPDGATGHYAISNFALLGDLTHFHLHAWTTNQEDQTSTANRFIMGSTAASGSNNHLVTLQRNGQNGARSAIGASTGNVPLKSNAASIAGVGLLSSARQGGSQKLYANGAVLTTTTALVNAPITDGTSIFREGASDTSNASLFTQCTLRFLGYGFADWTDADEVALNAMITAFNTALA